MSWKAKLVALLLVAIPAFVGYPQAVWSGCVLPGLEYGPLAYLAFSLIVIRFVAGGKIASAGIGAGTLVSFSVVFTGGLIAYIKYLVGWRGSPQPSVYSPYYISLGITMITVIPLAIAVVSVVPFARYEQFLLSRDTGVGLGEKILLMVARVTNHIIYTVKPNLRQILREEYASRKKISLEEIVEDATSDKGKAVRKRALRYMMRLLYVGVAGICSSLEHIPLWTLEIAQLPDKVYPNKGET